MNPYDIEEENLDRLIDLALDEDGVSHDLATLSIIPREELQTAFITAKADGIISGIEVARRLIETAADLEEEVDF